MDVEERTRLYNSCKDKLVDTKVSIFHRKYPFMDPDDLTSEAYIALWRCTETYDPTKGKFITYAYLSIDNALRDYTRARRSEARVFTRNNPVSLVLFSDIDTEETKAIDSIVDDVEVDNSQFLLSIIKKYATSREYNWIIDIYTKDVMQRDIAIKHNITRQAVSFALTRLFKNLQSKREIKDWYKSYICEEAA